MSLNASVHVLGFLPTRADTSQVSPLHVPASLKVIKIRNLGAHREAGKSLGL